MAEKSVQRDSRSQSLPEWVLGAKSWASAFQSFGRTDGNGDNHEPAPGDGMPLAVLLQVLHSILNGTRVDLEAVHWLLVRIANGEFPTEATGTEEAPKFILQGVEKDVAASLAALLGTGSVGTSSPELALVRRRSLLSPISGNRASLFPLETVEGFATPSWQGTGNNSLTAWNALVADPSVAAVLTAADTWRFDAFLLDKLTEQTPLSTLGFWVLQSSGVIEELRLDQERLMNFLRAAEARYPCGSVAPYHNNIHACDVLQHTYLLFKQGGLAKASSRKEPMAQLAAFVAAIVHDLDHQGVSNDYLIKTEDRLALLYNDASPQENHHLATAFDLLKQPDYNFLGSLSKDNKAKFRHLVVSMVLATDMKRHMKLFSAFKAKSEVQRLATARGWPSRRLSVPGSRSDSAKKPSGSGVRPQISGVPFEAVPMMQKWVKALEEEMFLQGDREAAGMMEVSPLMDRKKEGVTKSQCDFLSRVVIPMFEAWVSVFPDAAPMLSNAESNYRQWKKLQTATSSSASGKSVALTSSQRVKCNAPRPRH